MLREIIVKFKKNLDFFKNQVYNDLEINTGELVLAG